MHDPGIGANEIAILAESEDILLIRSWRIVREAKARRNQVVFVYVIHSV